jgi:hypothetical protein
LPPSPEATQRNLRVLEDTSHSGERASGSAHLDIEPLERVSIDRALQSVDLYVEALRKLHHNTARCRTAI